MSGGDPLDETLDSGAPSIPALFADRYRVLRPLGRGAAKEVYLVHDERLDRDVALALLTGGAAAARVRREMQVTGRLGEHPHVVTVHDAGEHDGVRYLILRALEGGSLAARVAAAPGRRLAVEEVTRLGAEIADGLEHAHAHGVVHRDVKPANVWLDGAGRAVIGDFGVALDRDAAARLTADRTVVGTLAYLSPEQARGDEATPASDLYGLGVTLYELACGRPPFSADSAEALIAQHLHAVPAPPSQHEPAAAPLDALLLRLLAKDPGQRPAAAAVRDELSGGAAVAPARRAARARRPRAGDARAARRLRRGDGGHAPRRRARGRGGDRQDALRGGAGRAGTSPRVRGASGEPATRTRGRPPTGRGARRWRSWAARSCCRRRRRPKATATRHATPCGTGSRAAWRSRRRGGRWSSCSRTSTGPIPRRWACSATSSAPSVPRRCSCCSRTGRRSATPSAASRGRRPSAASSSTGWTRARARSSPRRSAGAP